MSHYPAKARVPASRPPRYNPGMSVQPMRFSLKRRIAASRRMSVLFYAAAGLTVVFSFWYVNLRPFEIHRRDYHRISDSVESLVYRRPVDVPRNQWSFIIGWTMNGIGNCCGVDGYLNPDEESHKRFLTLPDRFDERLRGEVSLETIDWLWDELEAISKYGPRYSAQWRPTIPERLADAEYTSFGLEVP
ncbi:MAG: hypothetical protein EXS05_18365 [Planctomycetaceae bacterium]|nr:hypothetical protein [Planctomycetaceae bacterium]